MAPFRLLATSGSRGSITCGWTARFCWAWTDAPAAFDLSAALPTGNDAACVMVELYNAETGASEIHELTFSHDGQLLDSSDETDNYASFWFADLDPNACADFPYDSTAWGARVTALDASGAFLGCILTGTGLESAFPGSDCPVDWWYQ